MQKAALDPLAAHVLELLFAFKNVRRYRGPLVDSIGLTLVFGLLHWKPLLKKSAAGRWRVPGTRVVSRPLAVEHLQVQHSARQHERDRVADDDGPAW